MSSDASGTQSASRPEHTTLEPAVERLVLRRSRLLLSVLWCSHLLAFAAVLIAGLSGWWRALLLVAVAGSLWRESRRATSVRAIERLEEGGWRLVGRDGGALAGRLAADAFVHPRLVILGFELDRGGRRHVVLLPDAADADGLRRLRVWLRRESGVSSANLIARLRRWLAARRGA